MSRKISRRSFLAATLVLTAANAPPEWQDRAVLWNAVEEAEKTKDSRLAREFVVALPIELTLMEQQQLLTDFIKENFVADGMCADVCIYDTDGHNPHAHIMLTVRPLDNNGKWQYKTEKEYLCVKNGEERSFTAAEYKAVQADGWEKQYQYKIGKKKVYFGHKIPANKVVLDRNLTLGELNHGRSPLGWLVWAVLTVLLKASIKRGKPDLNILFQYNMPLRALAKMTNGAISMGMVDGIVLEVRGFWFVGILKVIYEFIKNLILNAKLEKKLAQ